jgi:hypothetical protein
MSLVFCKVYNSIDNKEQDEVKMWL